MIVVAGATGTVGSQVLRALSGAGIATRALSRKGTGPHVEGATWVAADLSDADALEELLEGTSAAFLSCATGPDQARLESNFIAAAERAGVRRIVKLSGADAYPQSVSDYRRANGLVEQRLLESDLDFAILRPTSFIQNIAFAYAGVKKDRRLYDPLAGTSVAWTDVRDIAEVSSVLLQRDTLHRRIYELTGPAPLAYDRIAEMMSAIAGESVTCIAQSDVETYQRLVGAGRSPQGAAEAICHYQATRLKTVPFVSGWTEILTGKPARSMEGFLGETAEDFS